MSMNAALVRKRDTHLPLPHQSYKVYPELLRGGLAADVIEKR
jgi:hypothetical protein